MKKRLILFTLTGFLSMSAVTLSFSFSNSSIFTNADVEPYTLTINATNKSNFAKDGNVYRGTFKTGLGNDIVFRSKVPASSQSGVLFEFTNVGDYLINETPLRGVTKIEYTVSRFKGDALQKNYSLYTYYLAGVDQYDLDFYKGNYRDNINIDQAAENVTYVQNTSSSNSGRSHYYTIGEDYLGKDCKYVFYSIKYYFSCDSTKNFVSVTSSDSSKGTVTINSEIATSSRGIMFDNGASCTIHAYPTSDYKNEKFVTFKGWRLYGSEEYISTNKDYSFIVQRDSTYRFIADFVDAETELFDHGEHIADDEPHTFVKNKNNKYFAIEGCAETNGLYTHTSQPDTRKSNELFIERHEFITLGSSFKSYFKLNHNPIFPGSLIREEGPYIHNDLFEKFDPSKVKAVLFYLAMDEGGRIDDLTTTNGNIETYKNLQDASDGDKAMSIVVWTNFTTAEANFYVPDAYRDGGQTGTLWIKRMRVVYN